MAKLTAFAVAAAAIAGTQATVVLTPGADNACTAHPLGAVMMTTDLDKCFEMRNANGATVSQKHTMRDGKLVMINYGGATCGGAGTEQMVALDSTCGAFTGPFDFNMPRTPASVKATNATQPLNLAATGAARTLTVDVAFNKDCTINAAAGAYGASIKVNFKEGACTTISDAVGPDTLMRVPDRERATIMANTAAMKATIGSGYVVFQTFTDPECKYFAYTALAQGLPLNSCLGPVAFVEGQAPMSVKIACDGGAGCTGSGGDGGNVAPIAPSAAAGVRGSNVVAVAAAVVSVVFSAMF